MKHEKVKLLEIFNRPLINILVSSMLFVYDSSATDESNVDETCVWCTKW